MVRYSDLTERIDRFETQLRADNDSRRRISGMDDDVGLQYVMQMASFLYELSRRVDKLGGAGPK